MSLNDVAAPIICITKGKRIITMARGDLMISSIESGYELCAVERQQTQESLKDLIPIELIITQ